MVSRLIIMILSLVKSLILSHIHCSGSIHLNSMNFINIFLCAAGVRFKHLLDVIRTCNMQCVYVQERRVTLACHLSKISSYKFIKHRCIYCCCFIVLMNELRIVGCDPLVDKNIFSENFN